MSHRDELPLCRFGIITDTHIRAPQGDQSSPFPVNDLANDRARYATRLLAAQDIEFTIHLGDMVHPLPHMDAYADACEHALEIFKPLPDLHFMPGNHDIGDKPMLASPAVPATDNSTASYQQFFGDSYYQFEHNNIDFFIINSSILNTGTSTEKAQCDWLQSALAASSHRKILFSHYPLFVHDAAEPEHYDNIAMPARYWLLNLIETYRIEAVYSGHVHHFFYNRHHDCKMHILPATSFTRQDYAEIFRIAPMPEFGRNDSGKFSVAVVEVYNDSIKTQLIPTDGAVDSAPALDNSYQRRSPPSLKPFNVHLRHSWHASIDLPYNGPMEEFSRKRCRNDYTLLRLQQTGIYRVRVPLADLLDPDSRARIHDYQSAGIEFSYFTMASSLECTTSAATLLSPGDVLEVIIAADSDDSVLGSVINNNWPATILLSKAHSSSHASDSGKPYAHSVSSGFVWPQDEAIIERLNRLDAGQRISGVVFQVPLEQPLTDTLIALEARFESEEKTCTVSMRLAHSNPAEANFDDAAIQTRIVDLLQALKQYPAFDAQIDTFSDVDRGYNPRHGFIDRHFNLRECGRTLTRC